MGSHSKWDWKRLHKIADTYLNEWMRQVEFNDALLSEISITRQRFDFPLNDLDAAIQWSSDNPSGYADLSKIMNSLAEKFQINEHWSNGIFYLIVINEPLGRIIPMGLPGGIFRLEDGEIIHDIDIIPEVDINIPIVHELIRHWQQKEDLLPRPLPVKGNSKKLDWFPVWA